MEELFIWWVVAEGGGEEGMRVQSFQRVLRARTVGRSEGRCRSTAMGWGGQTCAGGVVPHQGAHPKDAL